LEVFANLLQKPIRKFANFIAKTLAETIAKTY